MPMYEFQCPAGHVSEDLVPIGTEEIVCQSCLDSSNRNPMKTYLAPMAARILSATPTTFEFADNRRKKSIT